MHLELTEPQRELLAELLREYIADNNAEIHHAMDHAYREQLHRRRAVAEALLQQLGVVLQPATP